MAYDIPASFRGTAARTSCLEALAHGGMHRDIAMALVVIDAPIGLQVARLQVMALII